MRDLLPHKTQPHSGRLTFRCQLLRFWRGNAGVAAAEAVMLALVFIGLGLMVGRILKPAIQTAARNLNQELAGGASR